MCKDSLTYKMFKHCADTEDVIKKTLYYLIQLMGKQFKQIDVS